MLQKKKKKKKKKIYSYSKTCYNFKEYCKLIGKVSKYNF